MKILAHFITEKIQLAQYRRKRSSETKPEVSVLQVENINSRFKAVIFCLYDLCCNRNRKYKTLKEMMRYYCYYF